jgi:hypothetical protein
MVPVTQARMLCKCSSGSWSMSSNVQLLSPVGVGDRVPEGFLVGGSLMHR